MRLENLKRESPPLPNEIRNMIEQEVKAQVNREDTNTDNGKVISMRRSFPKAAAAALIATLAIGTTALAAVNYFQWKLEKEGNYGAAITAIQSEEAAKQELQVLSVAPKWLPAGMVQDEEMKYSFETNRRGGGISMALMLMDRDLSESKTLLEKDVLCSETMAISEYQSIYLEKAENGFNKRIYMALPEYGYILECYGGDDLAKEDLIRILENLEIRETGERVKADTLLCFSDAAAVKEEAAADPAGEEMLKISHVYAIGEACKVEDDLQATVKSVELYDDFSALNPEFIDPDMRKAVGADGKLKAATVRYMKKGNGTDTLDQEIRVEEAGQKLVYATVEYTNTGAEVLKDICYLISFNSLVGSGNQYAFYDRAAAKGNADIDYYTTDREEYGRREMTYYDVRGGERGNNYIPELKPGETITIHAAAVIFEDEADKLYLSPAADLSLTGGIIDPGLH